MEEVRKTEILSDTGLWEEIHFVDLKKGQIFRMWEPTGEAVKDHMGSQWKALSDSYMDENGQLIVDVGPSYKEGE